MSIKEAFAIDVHGHYGAYVGEGDHRRNEFMSADVDEVIRRAREANIAMTIISPLQALLPRNAGDPLAGNRDAVRVVAEHPELRQWAVVNPLVPETYDQAREILQSPNCFGIKIHPEEHGYPITQHGDQLFAFAAEMRTIVLTHSGEERSLPMDFVPFANAYADVRLILAHLGSSPDDDPTHHTRAILASHYRNIYADTSSASSLLPGLIEWAVQEGGSDRILFGTDTPVYFAAMHRARIDHAGLNDREKRAILWDNAVRLFGLRKIDTTVLLTASARAAAIAGRALKEVAAPRISNDAPTVSAAVESDVESPSR